MKTTPEIRQQMRLMLGDLASGRLLNDLLDDFATLEAELAALRRVDDDGMQVSRRTGLPPSASKRSWMVGDGSEVFGVGGSLAEALADYDAKKAQDVKGRIP